MIVMEAEMIMKAVKEVGRRMRKRKREVKRRVMMLRGKMVKKKRMRKRMEQISAKMTVEPLSELIVTMSLGWMKTMKVKVRGTKRTAMLRDRKSRR
ncbi:hypothetical protein DND36_31500 [Pseudomonas savastanoi pv. glycinea]|nr:hypothetical protein DND36_31500 [Pseudomonas savastanoi pv. glycinea]